MNTSLKLAFVIGTRPEAIKLAPLILLARHQPGIEVIVAITGQHREMLDPVLEFFGIEPDENFQVMVNNQGLSYLTSKVLESVTGFLKVHKPDFLLVQGDTTTVLAASLAAFYERVPICHVEAGLRTHDIYFPYPEEMNRVITSRLASYHFCPTKNSAQNLAHEGVEPGRILITGNTVVDALNIALKKTEAIDAPIPGLPVDFLLRENKLVLITGHRRESFGEGFNSICRAIGQLAHKYPDVDFVYPVHLNPNVREPVYRLLQDRNNVHLIQPADYPNFVRLMKHCFLILTDSGGIQEEAPSLKKPVLIMRDNTERPEGVEAGVVKLVGTDEQTIVRETSLLLESATKYSEMVSNGNPYGDGLSSNHILNFLIQKGR